MVGAAPGLQSQGCRRRKVLAAFEHPRLVQVALVAGDDCASVLGRTAVAPAARIATDEGAEHLGHGELSALGGRLHGATFGDEELKGLVQVGAVFSNADFIKRTTVLDGCCATFHFIDLETKMKK